MEQPELNQNLWFDNSTRRRPWFNPTMSFGINRILELLLIPVAELAVVDGAESELAGEGQIGGGTPWFNPTMSFGINKCWRLLLIPIAELGRLLTRAFDADW